MIIECEKCASKFSLDETLLKSDGSKVRCSMCKHVFTAYPMQQVSDEALLEDKAFERDMQDTLPLDSADTDFDLAFEKALKEVEHKEPGLEEIASEEGTDVLAEGLESEPDDDEAIYQRKRKKPSKILILVLSIVLLIVVGGTFLYLSLQNSREKQESADPGVKRLSFRAVTGAYVESNIEGQLFVIKGMVTNNYPKPRSYILLKGSIHDDKGKIVTTAMAYAGNSFSDKEIKELSSADLKKGHENRVGDNETNVNIPSGGTIPFMIVFEKLPEDIAEFTVEVVSSAPGK